MAGARVRKWISKLRDRSFAGWNSGQLRSILEGVGCTCREKKHIVCIHHDPHLRITIPRGDDLPPVYARETLKIVDALESDSSGEEDEE